jgi:hypothetical protein
MVKIELDGEVLEIQVQGMHKLWALKSSLRVPLSDVRDVRHDPERARRVIPGLRVPGTHIPYVYTAGTFYQSDFRPDFWTVRNADNAIVIQCGDRAAFDEIIVEVEDPAAVIAMIRNALPKRA